MGTDRVQWSFRRVYTWTSEMNLCFIKVSVWATLIGVVVNWCDCEYEAFQRSKPIHFDCVWSQIAIMSEECFRRKMQMSSLTLYKCLFTKTCPKEFLFLKKPKKNQIRVSTRQRAYMMASAPLVVSREVSANVHSSLCIWKRSVLLWPYQ